MTQIVSTITNPAALPWYNFPSTRRHLDSVWAEARSQLVSNGINQPPMTLNHTIPYQDLFTFPQLTLSQCCGLDLFQSQTENIEPFAAPVITVLDVPPGQYFSYIVARPFANLDTPNIAINNRFSHSGHTAIKTWLHTSGLNNYAIFESGAHAQSLIALREGRADLAAIDGLSWRHLDTAGLDILDTSESAPAPPFIRGRESTIAANDLIAALNAGFARHGSALGITGVIPAGRDDYLEVRDRAFTDLLGTGH